MHHTLTLKASHQARFAHSAILHLLFSMYLLFLRQDGQRELSFAFLLNRMKKSTFHVKTEAALLLHSSKAACRDVNSIIHALAKNK